MWLKARKQLYMPTAVAASRMRNPVTKLSYEVTATRTTPLAAKRDGVELNAEPFIGVDDDSISYATTPVTSIGAQRVHQQSNRDAAVPKVTSGVPLALHHQVPAPPLLQSLSRRSRSRRSRSRSRESSARRPRSPSVSHEDDCAGAERSASSSKQQRTSAAPSRRSRSPSVSRDRVRLSERSSSKGEKASPSLLSRRGRSRSPHGRTNRQLREDADDADRSESRTARAPTRRRSRSRSHSRSLDRGAKHRHVESDDADDAARLTAAMLFGRESANADRYKEQAELYKNLLREHILKDTVAAFSRKATRR